MQINISGQHVDVTPALRDYVQGKLSRLERHFEQMIDIHVVLQVEKLTHKAEATVHVARKSLHADAIADDMYAAIDALVDKLDRQVKKLKGKRTNYRNDVPPKEAAGRR